MPNMPGFATVDPFAGMTADAPGRVQNLCAGEWQSAPTLRDDLPDPRTGERFLDVPFTTDHDDYIAGLAGCSKHGLHNPLQKPGPLRHAGRRLRRGRREARNTGG